jgi:hypothetical protein
MLRAPRSPWRLTRNATPVEAKRKGRSVRPLVDQIRK